MGRCSYALQLFLGDRCDCARQTATTWFSGLEQDVRGLAEVTIPDHVNGKTRPRVVPLHQGFADLLWGWVAKQPLTGGKSQWPFEGQNLHVAMLNKKSAFLFCGKSGRGKNKPNYAKPISERAFLKQIHRASEILQQERAAAHRLQQTHEFDDVNLKKVGTHSWKKTAVTLMKDNRISTSLVASLTGTSAKTLDSVYDVPNSKRQRKAVSEVFTPITKGLNMAAQDVKPAEFVCRNCNGRLPLQVVDSSWTYCPLCAMKLQTA